MRNYKPLNIQEFESGEFKLIPIRNEDRYLIMKWRNEQMYHLRQNKKLNEKDQDSYFENVVSNLFSKEQPEQILFSFLKDGELIGYGGLVHINWIDKNAEISFLMNTEFEKDYFQEYWLIYLGLIEKIAFQQLSFHKIFTYAFDLRPKLYDILEIAGFSQEAKLIDHSIFENEYKNIFIHSKFGFEFRKIEESDLLLTFDWATDNKLRQYSFNKTEIDFETHKNWFYETLTDNNVHYFFYALNKMPVGLYRINKMDNQTGLISFLVNPKYHGNGIGYKMVSEGIDLIRKIDKELKTLKAEVMNENIASLKIFQNLNFSIVHISLISEFSLNLEIK